MPRTRLYADPSGRFIHDVILETCRRFPQKTAIVDTSCDRRISYAEYGELVENIARGFAASGTKAGEVIAIFLHNSWEFCVTYHACTLAGAIPTLLNPTFREREVRYQLENSGASILITDGPNIAGINLAGLPSLRRVYFTRNASSACEPFANLLRSSTATLIPPYTASEHTLAALPYSSGTTGLPKGVMLTHYNLVANLCQCEGMRNWECFREPDTVISVLPFFHIYGLVVIMKLGLANGSTIVSMPRFDMLEFLGAVQKYRVTILPLVPPIVLGMVKHPAVSQFDLSRVRMVFSGAAPLGEAIARELSQKLGCPVVQGYGMTEASPVTHLSPTRGAPVKPGSAGCVIPNTEVKLADVTSGRDVAQGEEGEVL